MVDVISFTACAAVACTSGPCCVAPTAIQVHSWTVGYAAGQCASIQTTSVRVAPIDAPIISVVINGITSSAITPGIVVNIGGVDYRVWAVNPVGITACGGQTLTYVMTGCDGVPWTATPSDLCFRCTTICANVVPRQTLTGLLPTGKFLTAVTSLVFATPCTQWVMSVQDVFATRVNIGSYCGVAKSSWTAVELALLIGNLPYICPNFVPPTGNCNIFVSSANLDVTALTVTWT